MGINVDGEDAGTISDPVFLMEVRLLVAICAVESGIQKVHKQISMFAATTQSL